MAVGYQMSYIQEEGFSVSQGASAKYGPGVYAFDNELTARAHAGFQGEKAIAKFQVGPGVHAERIVLERLDGKPVTYIRLNPMVEGGTTVRPTSLEYINVSPMHQVGYASGIQESGQKPVLLHPARSVASPSSVLAAEAASEAPKSTQKPAGKPASPPPGSRASNSPEEARPSREIVRSSPKGSHSPFKADNPLGRARLGGVGALPVMF
jgi:hypothetical protein